MGKFHDGRVCLGAVDNDLIVYALRNVGASLDTLPRANTARFGINFVQTHAAVKAAVSGVATKADATSVAHPHGWVGLLALGGEDAVVIDVITKRVAG